MVVKSLIYSVLSSILCYELYIALDKLHNGQVGTLIEREPITMATLPSMAFCAVQMVPSPTNRTFVEQFAALEKNSEPLLIGVAMAEDSRLESAFAVKEQ